MELKEDHFVSQSQTEIRMDFFRVFSDFVEKSHTGAKLKFYFTGFTFSRF